ncbi:hypothetical protein KUH03_38585 [Sphingobacterium sp. E70]|uniref:hypothetical protein n=1 Tax=Sphingobacterium sp. E70 TaxID=2853439 RepID=UPI00211B961F|nr:hypothetical protein [Sphingobacterium sp. E70]ULT24752.1 hypothetical protein KUH03_38585 [Sphingobacterium sp. E70]
MWKFNQKKTDGSDTATANTIERVRIEQLTNGTPGPEKRISFCVLPTKLKPIQVAFIQRNQFTIRIQ